MCGHWSPRGWWSYYLFACLVKVPIGTLVLGLLTFCLTVSSSRYRCTWRHDIVVLLPACVLIMLVSSQTGFSRYFRYLLPAFPLLFVWCGKLAMSITHRSRLVAVFGVTAFTWSFSSAMAVYPHSMSYFNEFTGGPHGGHRFLLDANIDWGQDMCFLKRWYDNHPNSRPLKINCIHPVSVAAYGFESNRDSSQGRELIPGWYAVSVHTLFADNSPYKYLTENHQPVCKTGYSIWVYRIP